MTTGQFLFYAGAALLAVTAILAVVFLIKKPVYRPENTVYADSGRTQKLHSGYPTDRLTIRAVPADPAPADGTATLSDTVSLNSTAALPDGAAPLDSTAVLPDGTVPLDDGHGTAPQT